MGPCPSIIVGKTCVLRALRHRLPQAGFRLTYCHNATLGRRDFYRYLCHALGLQPTSSAANLFLAVERHVHELRRDQVHPVFLLDEAHLLHPDMMAHLHILLNHEWDSDARDGHRRLEPYRAAARWPSSRRGAIPSANRLGNRTLVWPGMFLRRRGVPERLAAQELARPARGTTLHVPECSQLARWLN
jgi:hypothetical protein